jgi:Ca-activated chloride channel homolog
MRKVVFLLWIVVSAAAVYGQDVTQGSLLAVGKTGKELGLCPLKSTDVKTEISGFLARVRVEQEFVNSYSQPIEAVYIFPLSQNGAVDAMTMTVGSRVINGKIMKRDDARQTYEAAKSEGKTASLLDQERPNIFTQAVANIMPGERVLIEINYVETLKYEDGAYEFVFPMVVAPRYIPAGVKDAARISQRPAPTRGGHDISIEVSLNAGVPVEQIRSTSHRVDQVNYSPNSSKVTLREGKVIPNKDFILRYDVTGKRIEDAVLVHRDQRGGFFTLMLQPPDKIATEDRTPKEIVFVLDSSGSMEGFPIEKAKEAIRLSLDGLYPEDTFNLITFAGDTEILFDGPVPATQANLERAQAFLAGREGSGGTEMMKAIKAALDPSDSADHLRIVCFMTDGEVGNDDEIVAEVQRHPNARVFSFGIGSSVNRSLLDRIAQEGKGEAEYIAFEDDGSKAAKKFYERVRTPLLTNLSIDWNGMPVADLYPNKLTDLFSAKPVVLNGRYTRAASGSIKLRGKVAGQPYERTISLSLPEKEEANGVLSTLWARTRIADLSSQSLKESNSEVTDAFDKQITHLGLEFGLLTQFTSFVAVEDRVVNQNGKPVTMSVPVESPERTINHDQDARDAKIARGDTFELKAPPPQTRGNRKFNKKFDRWGNPNGKQAGYSNGTGSGGGSGRGSGSGNGSGTGTGYVSNSDSSPPPPRPAATTGIQESVNVTAGAAATVEVTTSTVETTINSYHIQSLPLQGRNFTSLLTISPGVRVRNAGGFQVDGMSGTANTFVIDGAEVSNFRTGAANRETVDPSSVESDELTGKILFAAKPVYTGAARTAKAGGEVAVEIEIGSNGVVTSAKAGSGAESLRKSAERAAMLSKFAPTYVSGRAIKVVGTLIYAFQPPKSVSAALRDMKAAPLSPEDKQAIFLSEKLHFWVSALLDRLNRGVAKPGAYEIRFVRNGKAEIQIALAGRSPEVIQKLKAAGFEFAGLRGASSITGRIAIEKIAALAEIREVKLILPKI